MEFVFLAAGILLGALICWLFLKGKNQQNDPRAAELDRSNAALKAELKSISDLHLKRDNDFQGERERREEELKMQRAQVNTLTDLLGRKEAELKNAETRLNEQKKELEDLQNRFTKEFENLANRIFEEKSKKFTEQNKTQLHDLLNPLGEKIKAFEEKVQKVYNDESQERATLKGEVMKLHELNVKMSKDAENLTKALKGENKSQGNWGEYILTSILEKSGLVKDREYRAQESFTTEDGRRFQPDVVIDLPDGKHIVVDSKVTLVAYERYAAAETEDERNAAIRDHISAVKEHVKDLSRKNYQKLYQLNSLDFVLLFLPVEPAFALALQNDRELFNDAFEMNIVIVSPSTLLATLRTVANIWRQEMQNRNVLKIAEEAAAMYDKFVGFSDAMIDVGKKMDDSKKSYETAMNRLVEGSGNVVRRIENLKKLGLKVSKSIDPKLLDRASEEEGDTEVK